MGGIIKRREIRFWIVNNIQHGASFPPLTQKPEHFWSQELDVGYSNSQPWKVLHCYLERYSSTGNLIPTLAVHSTIINGKEISN